MGIFRKNKRHFGIRLHRRLFATIFLLSGIVGFATNLLLEAQGAEGPVESVEFSSNHLSYANNEPGAWKVTKSAKWIGAGKARITFKVESVAKYANTENLDVLMVIDNSSSMSGNKIAQVKTDVASLATTLLSGANNNIALVTFNSGAEILSGFTNNAETIVNHINSINGSGNANYYQGFVKAEEVLANYEHSDSRELVLLFLTDGLPNEETPNEKAQYEKLKTLHPYMIVNGVQYGMGDEILEPIAEISDNQYAASMANLGDILFNAIFTPDLYDNFVITDYIDDEYWTLDINGDDPSGTIVWDMSGTYRSGSTQTLTIDVALKDELLDEDLLLPTNTRETIMSSIRGAPDENIDSNLSPILKTAHNVIYDANLPSGCEQTGATVPATAAHAVFAPVEISEATLSCSTYNFKGWSIATDGVSVINEDYFRMPESNVVLKAVWSKLAISKSMDGEVHNKVTATFDIGANVNTKMKRLSGQPDASYSTPNTIITAVKKADTLSAMVDINNDAYIVSAPYSMRPIYAWYDEGIIYYYTDATEIYLNTDTSQMFREMRTLASIDDVSNWDVSNVTNMDGMFNNAGYNVANFTMDLSSWNVSNVVNMNFMFNGAGYSATTWSIGNLSGWRMPSAMYMNSMFMHAGGSATAWSIGDISDWNVSNARDMNSMFSGAGYNAATWSIGDISDWNVSNVTSMNYMFQNAGGRAADWSIGNISGWNVSNVTGMNGMFNNAGYSATEFMLDLSNWKVMNVVDMNSMFSGAGYNAATWSIGDLSDWNVSSATSMNYMFQNAGGMAAAWSIGDISGWNVSNVTTANGMFNNAGYSATEFMLNLSSWKVMNVVDMNSMFSGAGYNAATWSIGDLSDWNVSNVTSMNYMFQNAGGSAANWSIGNISGWNVSNVTGMNGMFDNAAYRATEFMLNLSNWNVSSVEDMNYMFQNAGYNATNWQVIIPQDNSNGITNTSDMFYGKSTAVYARPNSGRQFTLATP